MAVAACSFSIWYFDLFPEMVPVPTGSLEGDHASDGFNEADFIAMLESAPENDLLPVGESGEQNLEDREPGLPSLENDPLVAALRTQQADSIEQEFPEFSSPLETDSVGSTQTGQGSSGTIQQAKFELTEPPIQEEAPEPVVLSAEIADQLRQVDALIDAKETLQAHAILSRMYWKDPGVRPHIMERLEKQAAEIYANPSTHFNEPYLVEHGDTLESIARQYKLPWRYLGRLNRISPQQLQAGQQLKVLTGPFGAVVDLSDFEMTLHSHGWFVRRYTIGIGADGGTPTGEFTVQDKLENPTWYSPDGGVVEADDPSNLLGEYWLGLGDHIGIHGTIDPASIGQAASRGCIHLADGDITEVFQLLGVGSPVVIRE